MIDEPLVFFKRRILARGALLAPVFLPYYSLQIRLGERNPNSEIGVNSKEETTETGGLPNAGSTVLTLESLLTAAGSGGGALTVRDDLYDGAVLLDAVRLSRRGGRRFRLVDSGRLDRFRLEWLLEAGADLYTSDETRTDIEELQGLLQAAGKGRSILAYFIHGSFTQDAADGEPAPDHLLRLGRAGAFLHVSNRERKRDPVMLLRLAEECEAGGSHLVAYHHGPFDPETAELSAASLWLHLDERSLAEGEGRELFLDMLKSPRSRARLVLFSEGRSEALWLREVLAAGAFVRFQRKQFDYRSPYKPLEKAAARKKLPHTAYYLHPTFLL